MSAEKYKRRLTAIFSADVVGYSRLMGEDEAATVDTITNYREIIADLIEQHRGRMVDSPGDNILAEFASVVDAAQCSVSVQKEIQARNNELPVDRRMQFRIGINLGDVIEEGERIYGDGVNIAARLEALADPGGICISKTAFDHIESKLPLGYEYIGEQSVKNISKPVMAYKVLMDPRIITSGEIKQKKEMPPWSKKSAIAVGIAIITIFMAVGIWSFYLGGRLTERATGGKASIVVLPFKNLSDDPELEYFSDGITEELIGALAEVRGLKVISQTSAFFYKGKDVDLRTVAEKLKVNNVLEGSVRKSGNKLRISAQLIKVADDTHLWSESYDREIKGGFDIQDEISMAVAKNLKAQLLGIEDELLAHDYLRRFSVDTIIKQGEKIEGGLSAFGANIEMAGTVNGGLEAFGANITISGKNQGDLKFAGANVILAGEFLDIVKGLSANLTISGTFEDDLVVRAARITIAPSAVIKGDFAYSTALFERKEGSQIMGKVVQLESEEGEVWARNKPQYEKGPDFLAKSLFCIISAIALIIVGWLVYYLLPKQTEEIVSTIAGSMWKSLGIGLIVLVVTPLCIIITLLTAIGIPAGIIMAFLYIIMIYISRVYVGLWIGRMLLGNFKESLTASFFWPLVTGTIIIGILLLIPVIGWLLRFFLLLIGLGAMWQVLWHFVKPVKTV
ncbi:MAG: adenylate/guanylate cyclase domain-containing protein [Thermodesulfobacteriota bacterium]|nr:adenylate/guanylate cyclase domain-containing protein [Thermodesulfobacteriota bacterium]